jgi:RimJ/RimL family protein N-acetyltransferase
MTTPADPGHRRYELPGGRTLVVRAVTPADADGLAALYAGFDDDDLHNRFFSVYRPDRAFVERVAGIVDHGGYGLVAVVDGPDDEPARLVAEAGWYPLPDGDGELAIAVAPDWRGWLGPVLLDALLEAAAAHGVPNLEAEVLVTNTPMQRLARARGVATMPSDDWVSTRLLIGSTGRRPTWPERSDRPRVLVETPGGRWHAAPEAAAAGLDVLACSGPRGPRDRCPVLAGDPCPLVAGADAVVAAWSPGDETGAAIVAAHHGPHPGVPVCVEARPGHTGPVAAPEGTVPAPEGDDARGTGVVRLVERLARSHAARSGGEPRRSAPPSAG